MYISYLLLYFYYLTFLYVYIRAAVTPPTLVIHIIVYYIIITVFMVLIKVGGTVAQCVMSSCPSRFLFLLLGPFGKGPQYHEIGRSIATLMTDEVRRLWWILVFCFIRKHKSRTETI